MVGASDRLEFTVLGDVVNVAARIEQATKRFKTSVLVHYRTPVNRVTALRDRLEHWLEQHGGILGESFWSLGRRFGAPVRAARRFHLREPVLVSTQCRSHVDVSRTPPDALRTVKHDPLVVGRELWIPLSIFGREEPLIRAVRPCCVQIKILLVDDPRAAE